MKNKHCEWCDHSFYPKVNYQIYCSPDCRESATREKITQKYIQNKIKARIGKVRKCKSCGTQLSIYNDEQICNACDINPVDVNKILKDMKDIIDEDK